jgi:acyl-CoA-binding protein
MDGEEKDDFEGVAERLGLLAVREPRRIPKKELIHFYGLYKTATERSGPSSRKPSIWRLADRRKWMAWNEAFNKYSPEEAQRVYIELSRKYLKDIKSKSSVGPVLSTLQVQTDNER